MFVIENHAMILLFFFLSKYSTTWFAFPVTVYVCTMSILGAVLRLVHFKFLLKGRVVPETSVTNEEVEAVGLAIQQELMNTYAMVQSLQTAYERWKNKSALSLASNNYQRKTFRGAFRDHWYVVSNAARFFVSSRNAPPHERSAALCDVQIFS